MNKWNLIILLVLTSCVSPFETDYVDADPQIIIDASITNLPGPYQVKVTQSLEVDLGSNNLTFVEEPITGAEVYVLDQNDNRFDFIQQDSTGLYYSDSSQFLAIPGNSYRLFVVNTPFGDFESQLEEMPDPVTIDDLRFAYEETEVLNENGAAVPVPNVNFYLDFVVPERETHIRYEWRGNYEYETQIGANSCGIDINGPNGPNTRCFVPEAAPDYLKAINLGGLSGGEQINDFLVLSLDPNKRFAYSYDMEVQQFAINQSAINYWEQIIDVRENNGSVFDPIPSSIRGNIFETGNSSQRTLGYFEVAAVTTKRIRLTLEDFLDQFEILNHYECDCFPSRCGNPGVGDVPFDPPLYCCDCLSLPGAQTVKPDYWND